MLPTRISVCTAPGLSMTTTRRVGGGGSTGFAAGASAPRPLAERALGAGERLFGGDVADDGEDGVVGAEPLLVERQQIVARDARRSTLGVPESRPAVRMEPVDQPIEHDVGEELRILVADLACPTASAAAAARSPRARTPGCCATSETMSSPKFRLSFITTALMKRQIGAGAGAHRAADRVDRVGDLLRRSSSSCPGRAARRRARRRRACRRDPARRRRGRSAAG